MKLSLVLFSCVAFALLAVSVSASIDVEWIQPAFVEVVLPTPGQACGHGGVCSAKAQWCGQKTVVHGLCAGAAVCCQPKQAAAAPTPAPAPSAAPAAPAPPKPAPAVIIPSGHVAAADSTRVAPAVAPVPVVAPATGGVQNLPVGDLSPLEASVDGGADDTPLDSAATAALPARDAAAAAVPSPNVPPLTYDIKGLMNDDILTVNGQVVHTSAGPSVGAGAATTRKGVIPAVGAVPNNGACGAYAQSSVTKIAGNGGIVYEVVKMLPQHAQDPSMLNYSPSQRDNTMRTATACAFDKMHNAAKAAGHNLLIASAFRTLPRQQYFWNCYLSKKCNGGHLAAHPGSSNHGRGLALDLNQAAPGMYAWLAAHAHDFGFVRTVPKEKWHWEYRPGTPKARYT